MSDALLQYVEPRTPSTSNNSIQDAMSASSSLHRNLRFPSFRSVLWDRTARGPSLVVDTEDHFPHIRLPISVLKRVFEICSRGSPSPGDCIGHFSAITSMNEAFIVDVTDFVEGEIVDFDDDVLPIQVFTGADFSSAQYAQFVKSSLTRMCSREPLHLSTYLALKCCVHPSISESSQQQYLHDTNRLSLYGEIIAPSASFSFSPISALRLVSSPLASSLLADTLPSSFRSGYLTLDQYRNAVPLLDSDHSAFKLPLVGVWICGSHSLRDVRVWMSCIRFLYNSSIKDRVTVSALSFLVLRIEASDRHPASLSFTECTATINNNRLLHHQFGSEIFVSGSSVPRIDLRCHHVLDETANLAFTQALHNRGWIHQPANSNESHHETTAILDAERSKSKTPSHSLSPKVIASPSIDTKTRSSPPSAAHQTSIRIRAAAPIPQPRPTISPSPWSTSTDHSSFYPPNPSESSSRMSMMSPPPSPTHPFWAPPQHFYDNSLINDSASQRILELHQRQFELLQQKVQELTDSVNACLQQQKENEKVCSLEINCSDTIADKKIQQVSQATSTHELSQTRSSSSSVHNSPIVQSSRESIPADCGDQTKSVSNSQSTSSSSIQQLDASTSSHEKNASIHSTASSVHNGSESGRLSLLDLELDEDTSPRSEQTKISSPDIQAMCEPKLLGISPDSGDDDDDEDREYRISNASITDIDVGASRHSMSDALFDIPRIEYSQEDRWIDSSDDEDAAIAQRYIGHH